MRAAVMRNLKIVTDEVPDPTPGPGEVLVKTLACGICGSDLHALKHAKQFVDNAPGGMGMDIGRDVVMGHEFCAEILDYGPQTTRDACGRYARVFVSDVDAQRRAGDGGILERRSRRIRRTYGADGRSAVARAERPAY